ncbi:hypothetical protein APHAL10511_002314 [Amanita phalloides]|nr:hypothetical protein APHAL10511_002314 [Amanita phalloides]
MDIPNLTDMMTHRPLDELHYCWQVAMNYIEQHTHSRQQLREAKRRLKQQLREFTMGRPVSPCSSVSSTDESSPEAGPSVPVTAHFSPARPDAYPHEILWTYEEYEAERRPDRLRSGSLPFAIRHANGKPISQVEWSAIVTVTNYVEYDLLVQTNSRDGTGKLCRRLSVPYYRSFHREWSAAIDKLEKVCPILGLCAYHWKAEMVLRWALQRPGDPEDPRRPTSGPCAFVQANVRRAGPHLDDLALSCSTVVKRPREVSISDSYPSKRLAVEQALQIPALPQIIPVPAISSTAIPTASTSTINVSHQASTPTRACTDEEIKRMVLELKLGQLYKADIYDFVLDRRLASVHKRTLKKDLVAIVLNAALADKSIAEEVDKMFTEDLPQKRMNRYQAKT